MCVTCGCDGADAAPGQRQGSAIRVEAVAARLELRLAGRSQASGARAEESLPAHWHGSAVDARPSAATLRLEQRLLARNAATADDNRRWLAERRILALNLVSSPGSGKTTLLERTIRDIGSEIGIHVLEGDQATDFDATRIRLAGAPAVQVNTGAGCHLDATMVERALRQLAPPASATLMIENVGNLVCPALFDLGERAKVVVASVTEGEDKPAKYPHMFRAAELMLLNKIDLLPHLRFDLGRCLAHARAVNPRLEVLEVSAATGAGMESWYDWIRRKRDRG